MKEHNMNLVTQLTKKFISEMQDIEPSFERAFFRFHAEERMYDSCSSYTTTSDVFIVSALMHDHFLEEMEKISLDLLTDMKKNPALILLTVEKNFDYEIQFEYENMDRWQITLMNGGAGIPKN